MSNRISHFYNLRGPSLTLDTGCSASLVGFHLACQSLISGESDLGIAMGAGMILTPNTIMPMTSLGFMSPDGKCYTFDARANGYGRGEGIGVVIVKRLEDALRDNDTIRAVVRGSAVNQDGNTPGITMPSMEAQIDNINDVYRKAGLHPEDTAFVECHGTGTQAGDKRELQAVSEAIASKRSLSKGPVVVGSIKTNIGHLEGCAGVAGLIKGILTLEKAMIPKHLNFRLPGNPDIHFEKWRVTPPLELMDFPADGLRRASINCFGFGGTNAHVILDDAFHYLKERKLDGNHNSVEKTGRKAGGYDESKPLARLFVYSSNEAAGIERLAKSHWGYLKRVSSSTPSNFLASYAYTLSARRSNLDWKAYVVGKTLGDVLDKLSSIDARTATKAGRDRQPNIAYLFAGQGAQWTGMGKEMILSAPATLGKSIREASNFMRKHLGSPFDLVGEFLASTSCINDPIIAQPATTVVQVALVDFLASFGISPACVVGHSSGEIAAAYAGGYISREDAWRLSYHRGRCAGILRHDSMVEGKMLAAALTADLAESWINRARAYGRVVVACRNSPTSVTLSGDAEAVEDVAKMLNEAGIFNLILPVSTAYHSHHMLRVADMYLEAIRDVTVLRPSFERKVAMFSSVTGKIVSIEDDLGPEYWVRNMVSPVRFDDALAAMLQISSNGLTNGALNMAVVSSDRP